MQSPPVRLGSPLQGPLLVFGGVYSNEEALRTLMQVAENHGIAAHNVICTGDTPGYCADPVSCLDLLRDWGCHSIAGNVELNMRDGIDDCGCNFSDGSRCDLFARLWYAYARAEVTGANLDFMHTLPRQLHFSYAGRRVTVLHGSADHESEFIWKSTPWQTKQRSFDVSAADVIVAGHSGLPFADAANEKLWLNAGAIGMPANDGTPRTWYLMLDDRGGELSYTFHPLHYDHQTARKKIIRHRTRLPLSYAITLATGLWDNTEIMPPTETALTGLPIQAALLTENAAPAAPPPKKSSPMNPYSDPQDLRTFGKIAEWQQEMGDKFFNWYGSVTEGDTALTEREKALIALAVSHAIQCPYCIEAYTTNSLQSGADEEQMMEAVHVAAAVKAGTTLIYARQMQRQVEKITM